VSAPAAGARRRPLLPAGSDALAIAWRGIITYRRVPQLLVFSTIQPVVFVLMFRYVFGGAIHVPGVNYVDYLMPGIFVQTSVFGAIGTAIGLAADVKSGLLERFLSLPMARSAVLTGRTLADLARNVFVVALMSGVGFLVGFRVQSSALAFVAALLLVLAFGYVMAFNVPASWRGWDLAWLRAFVNPRENPTLLLVVSYSMRRLPFTSSCKATQTSMSKLNSFSSTRTRSGSRLAMPI
jgi:hypothetical protein